MDKGTLYIVPTPIGNLEDITLRATKTLLTVDIIACEDTRKAGILLAKLKEKYAPVSMQNTPNPPLLSYYEQNELGRIPQIIKLLQVGSSIALISDAGTPTVSDPGFKLIRECIAQNISIVSLPGASSVMTALTISGLPTDKFLFVGYLPHKSGHRQAMLEHLKAQQDLLKSTIILFEAPHKLLTTLQDIQHVFGNIPMVVCRELTKIHEEIRRETISETITHFTKKLPKGELVLLFHL